MTEYQAALIYAVTVVLTPCAFFGGCLLSEWWIDRRYDRRTAAAQAALQADWPRLKAEAAARQAQAQEAAEAAVALNEAIGRLRRTQEKTRREQAGYIDAATRPIPKQLTAGPTDERNAP